MGAQSNTPTALARNSDANEARIHRIEATVVNMPMGENEPPLRLDLLKLMQLYKVPGYDINDTVPTLVQIFSGEKPANTAPIRVVSFREHGFAIRVAASRLSSSS